MVASHLAVHVHSPVINRCCISLRRSLFPRQCKHLQSTTIQRIEQTRETRDNPSGLGQSSQGHALAVMAVPGTWRSSTLAFDSGCGDATNIEAPKIAVRSLLIPVCHLFLAGAAHSEADSSLPSHPGNRTDTSGLHKVCSGEQGQVRVCKIVRSEGLCHGIGQVVRSILASHCMMQYRQMLGHCPVQSASAQGTYVLQARYTSRHLRHVCPEEVCAGRVLRTKYKMSDWQSPACQALPQILETKGFLVST